MKRVIAAVIARFFYPIKANQNIPINKERIVNGIPVFKYSTNSSFIPFLIELSATIIFATEPSSVRFPAKVVAIEIISHAR